MNVLEPNKAEHLFKHSISCQVIWVNMLKRFLFLSITLHLSLLLLVMGSFTDGDIASMAWSTYDVTLVGVSGMGGTGVANAEKADKERITSSKPRSTHSPRKQTPQKQATVKTELPKSTATKKSTSHNKPIKSRAGGRQQSAGEGHIDSTPTGLPHGQGGFGQGHKGAGIGETNTLPVALRQVQPVYPRRARQRNITGKVIISCTVKVDGSVINPVVIESSPKGIFDKCACAALKQWTFRPALRQGSPVTSTITVPIRFELN